MDESRTDEDRRERRENGRSLGGTGTHHRASYSDPTPAAGEWLARQNIDEATGRPTPGPGSPEWMRQPIDQTGFGAHIAEDASSRKATMRDVRTGEEREQPDREELRKRGDGDPSAG
jgi:hypothetical protein